MYESRFGLTGLPFQLSPDPAFYYAGSSHGQAWSALQAGMARGDTLMVLTGAIGTGKTLLWRSLVEQLEPQGQSTVILAGSHLNADSLLESLLLALGLMAHAGSRAENRRLLHAQFDRQSLPTLVMIDEAHHLDDGAMIELESWVRVLLQSSAPVQLCLAGQPQLHAALATAPRRGLRKLINTHVQLLPLRREDMQPYVEHRLRRVGWSGHPAFDPAAFSMLHECTGGVPRRINQLCNRLLLLAFQRGLNRIDAAQMAALAGAMQAQFDGLPDPQSWAGAFSRPLSARRRRVIGIAADACDELQMAALGLAFRLHAPGCDMTVLHTADGQHSTPDWPPGHARQSGPPGQSLEQVMADVERHLARHRPEVVVVADGSAAAMASAQAAKWMGIAVVHLAAGRRSARGDTLEDAHYRSADHCADLLLTAEHESTRQLFQEGLSAVQTHEVGSLLAHAAQHLHAAATAPDLGIPPWPSTETDFALVALSPASIRDDPGFDALLTLLARLSRDLPLIWPLTNSALDHLSSRGGIRRLQGENLRCVAMPRAQQWVQGLGRAVCLLTQHAVVHDQALMLGTPSLHLGDVSRCLATPGLAASIPVGLDPSAATRAVWRLRFNSAAVVPAPPAWDAGVAQRVVAQIESLWTCQNRASAPRQAAAHPTM